MLRGLISGGLLGAIVGLSVAAVSSLIGDLPGSEAPRADVLDVPAGTGFEIRREDEAAVLPGADEVPVGDTPEVAPLSAPAAPVLDAEVTSPAAAPDTGDVEAEIAAPDTSTADVVVESEAPVLAAPQVTAPEAPLSENDILISTDPAQPVEPEVVEEPLVVAEATEDLQPTPQPEAPVVTEAAPEVPSQPEAPEAPVAPEPLEAEPLVEDPPATEDAPEPTVEEAEPEVAEAAEESAAIPEVGLGTRDTGVTTNRLPSIAVIGQDEAAPEVVEDAPAPSDGPAIEAFAAAFEDPGDKPLMSIVLIDQGNTAVQLAALASLSVPVSFAVDVTREDAADVMGIYRAAGFEVLALVDVPEGAGPSDIEVVLEAGLSAMPETVAMLDGSGSGFGGDRAVASQVAEVLLASGRGLVTYEAGLGTAVKVAESTGVPVQPILRDLDGAGQNAATIRRFLDQAAFRAGQENGVVVLGRMGGDMISALLIWEQQARAQTVTMAPISAVLTAE